MNQSGGSLHEPIMVGAAAVTLIEGAARDLEHFNEEILTADRCRGASPSFLTAWLSVSAAGG